VFSHRLNPHFSSTERSYSPRLSPEKRVGNLAEQAPLARESGFPVLPKTLDPFPLSFASFMRRIKPPTDDPLSKKRFTGK